MGPLCPCPNSKKPMKKMKSICFINIQIWMTQRCIFIPQTVPKDICQ
ncbi:unnamed protein product [Staurois parvus]|uniref:Uncharacterized protein n=1 Tax=Staurois parvus TaxID=386267 RepID=A0ABN9B4P3_9NEOB|nr:unnamed protein product [Staurois parvus]